MVEEDVVRVLRESRVGLVENGVILDLQVTPPAPVVEADGRAICSLEDGGLLDDAATATAVVDELVAAGRLRIDAVDDHDVFHRVDSGQELLDYFAPKRRSIPADAVARVAALERPCAVREKCRLRRLSVI